MLLNGIRQFQFHFQFRFRRLKPLKTSFRAVFREWKANWYMIESSRCWNSTVWPITRRPCFLINVESSLFFWSASHVFVTTNTLKRGHLHTESSGSQNRNRLNIKRNVYVFWANETHNGENPTRVTHLSASFIILTDVRIAVFSYLCKDFPRREANREGDDDGLAFASIMKGRTKFCPKMLSTDRNYRFMLRIFSDNLQYVHQWTWSACSHSHTSISVMECYALAICHYVVSKCPKINTGSKCVDFPFVHLFEQRLLAFTFLALW